MFSIFFIVSEWFYENLSGSHVFFVFARVIMFLGVHCVCPSVCHDVLQLQ